MKKILLLLSLAILLFSCENQEIEFPDFSYNAVYFPVQYPVRTLSLGEDRLDNSKDRELKFDIGISIGGMYENEQDWTVSYVVDESFCVGLVNNVLPMPQEYYTLNPIDEVVIPSGSFSGLIEVQLTEDFLYDSLATSNHYVIPLRITGTDADSILTGLPLIPDADKRIASQWDAGAPPKDFTLFMVKYINEYHGSYLRRGVDYTLDVSDNPIDTSVYRQKYVEEDQVVHLSTIGRREDMTNFLGVNTGADYAAKLVFEETAGTVSVDSSEVSSFPVTESINGLYVPDGDSWGGKDRDAIYLNYKYNDGNNDHLVFDTLVFRERGIKYEQFIPKVIE